MKAILKIIIFAVIIWLGYKVIVLGYDFIRPKSWTLFVYSSETPDTDYQTNRIDGYSKQTECLESGIRNAPKSGSYECGYDCRYKDEYYMEICDKVCSRSGCRD